MRLNYIDNIDCLEGLKEIPDNSVDLIVTDPPYGTTDCKWDKVVPIERLWSQYLRVLADTGVIVIFGSEPFSTMVRHYGLDLYKYDWVWVKNNVTGFAHSKNMPLKKHENVMVFSRAAIGHKSMLGEKRMTYNPQGVVRSGKVKRVNRKKDSILGARPNQYGKEYEPCHNFPTSVLFYDRDTPTLHPTQKPIALCELLIKTYSDPGAVVLDTFMGSGTTAVAAIRTGRNYIGFELDEKYHAIAMERVEAEIGERIKAAKTLEELDEVEKMVQGMKEAAAAAEDTAEKAFQAISAQESDEDEEDWLL